MDQTAAPAPRSPEPGHAAAAPHLPEDLPPEVDAAVRRLLAADPDPGAMPASVATRVSAALAAAARLRIEPGPLSARPAPSATGRSAPAPTPLIGQRPRRHHRPVLALAAVAAATVVVVAGGAALHLTTRPLATASLGDPGLPSRPSAGASPTAVGSNPALHIQLSRTDYDAVTLPALARDLVALPDAPVQVLTAEAPLLGPIATPRGLRSCLEELGIPRATTVHADLASYAGAPVAVLVTSLGGIDTAWVVGRQCTTGHPALVTGPVPLP